MTVFTFFIPKRSESDRKYSHSNSYNFVITLISHDDHLTAGAWAACGPVVPSVLFLTVTLPQVSLHVLKNILFHEREDLSEGLFFGVMILSS